MQGLSIFLNSFCQYVRTVQVFSMPRDPQLLINPLMDTTLPDWRIEAEVLTIRELMRLNPLWSFHWIPREGNYMAHHLARWGRVNADKEQLGQADIPEDIVCSDDSAVYRRVAYVG